MKGENGVPASRYDTDPLGMPRPGRVPRRDTAPPMGWQTQTRWVGRRGGLADAVGWQTRWVGRRGGLAVGWQTRWVGRRGGLADAVGAGRRSARCRRVPLGVTAGVN